MNLLRYKYYTGKMGVYCITNTYDNKVYVGSASDLYARSIYHKNSLKKGKHFNSHLQSAYNYHGSEYFNIKVLEVFSGDNEIELRLLENKYTQFYKALDRNYGYNYIEELGGKRKFSVELKQRMSDESVAIRPVISYNPSTDEITWHERRTGIGDASCTGVCTATKHGKLYKGCMWFNVEDYISDDDIREKNRVREEKKKTAQLNVCLPCLDLETGIYYDSLIDCERAINLARKNSEFYKRVIRLEEKKTSPAKVILNVETGVLYPSIADAARYNNVSKTHLGNMLASNNGVFRNLKQV